MSISSATPIVELEGAFEAFNHISRDLESAYRDLEQRVEGLNTALGLAHDQSAVRLKEKERLAQRLEHLLNALPAGVIVLDADGIISHCNPAATDLLQRPLLGEAWREVVNVVFAPRADDGHEISLQDGRRVNIATRSLGDEPGQLILINDVTETRALQARVSRLERLSALGRTAAVLAHQIRTPLSSALLYASALERGRAREVIIGRLGKLEKLVEDMLAFAGAGDFPVVPISLGPCLDDFVNGLQNQLKHAKASLDFHALDAEVMISGSWESLQSALQNLINNALEACGDGAQLSLRAELPDNALIRITLADDGPGVSMENQARIFEAFYTTRSNGTGLGLAVARAIVESHGGQLMLLSTEVRGTTLVIELPVLDIHYEINAGINAGEKQVMGGALR